MSTSTSRSASPTLRHPTRPPQNAFFRHEAPDTSLSRSRPGDTNMSPKREATSDDEYNSSRPVKRMRHGKYESGGYAQLLHDEIHEFLHGTEELSIKPTVLGLTTWSADERMRFFHVLGRKGRHEIGSIANHVHTKSEVEVANYLSRLRDAYVQRHLRASRLELPRFDELPAALEVRNNIENRLEKAADVLLVEDSEASVKREKELYGEDGIINGDNANDIYISTLDDDDPDEIDDDDDEASPEIQTSQLRDKTLMAASNLFDVPRMLELSQYVFMNSKHKDENWQTLGLDEDPQKPAEKPEIPAIFQSALMDLQQAVVAITSRIASTAHFLALTRMRSMQRRTPAREVREQDILTALKILDMRPNAKQFWMRCPRKCRLRVYKGRYGSKAQKLTYDEVEQVLGEQGRWPKLRTETVDAKTEERDAYGTDVADDESVASFMTQPSEPSSPGATSEGAESGPEDDPDDAMDAMDAAEARQTEEDAYADAVDLGNSRADEEQVRGILSGRKQVKLQSGHASAGTLHGSNVRRREPRKRLEELKDWTKWMDYQAQWERYETPVSIGKSSQAQRRVDLGSASPVSSVTGRGSSVGRQRSTSKESRGRRVRLRSQSRTDGESDEN